MHAGIGRPAGIGAGNAPEAAQHGGRRHSGRVPGIQAAIWLAACESFLGSPSEPVAVFQQGVFSCTTVFPYEDNTQAAFSQQCVVISTIMHNTVPMPQILQCVMGNLSVYQQQQGLKVSRSVYLAVAACVLHLMCYVLEKSAKELCRASALKDVPA